MLPIARAVRLAKSKSRHKCHRHAAILFDKKRILGTGWNHEIWHAEEELASGYWSALPGNRVLVIRIRRDGRLGKSRPCKKCLRMLKDNYVKAVYYSDENGDILEERL